MKINILQEDIDKALDYKKAHPKEKFSCSYNPIAIACLRMGLRNKEKDYLPAVSDKTIFAWKVTELLPEIAQKFLADFYNDSPVSPFSFETTTVNWPSWNSKDAAKVGDDCFFWWIKGDGPDFWWRQQ